MARVAVFEIAEPNLGQAKEKDYGIVDVNTSENYLTVKDLSPDTRGLVEKDYGIVKIVFKDRYTKPQSILPFRVAFTSVDVPGYGRGNPAPIGIAIIGTNNYIL